MHINRLIIKGFKSIKEVDVANLSPFVVFAGSNGAGKSNLADALSFISAVIQRGATQATRDFGGFQQIHCFKSKGKKRTTITFGIDIELDSVNFKYGLTITNLDEKPKIREVFALNGKRQIERLSKGNKINLNASKEQEMQELPDYPSDMTLLMLLGHSPIHQFLTNIKVFRFNPITAKEPDSSSTDATALDKYGKNVATMLSELEKNRDFKIQVMEWMELIVPGMENISTEKQRLDGSTVLTFKEQGTKARFPAQLISDGTIYAICIITAIISRSSSHGITIIEEPERGIHPKAIGELIQLMRDNASLEHPVFITTHSESVVRNTEQEELWLVNKSKGKTQLKSVAELDLDLQKLPLDKAWLMNLFDAGLPW